MLAVPSLVPLSSTGLRSIASGKIVTVFLVNKQHALTWLSEDWLKMTKKHEAVLMDVRIEAVYYPDIDPIDVSGYEDPTNADMIYSVDFKSDKISYSEV